MLRNLNATYAGRRILASPQVGVLASVIAAETAEGDHGPGILYNESVDPTYAGKYLRAWVTNSPAVGKLSVAENGAIEAVDLPNGVHTFSYDLIVNDLYDSASSFSITVGAVDAVATGGVGAGVGIGSGGDAVGQVAAVAGGGVGAGTGSGVGGGAAGEAGGSATATGGTGSGAGAGSGGAASGQISAVVSGGAGTGTGAGTGGNAVGGSADAVASGGSGSGVGVGAGGAAVGNADIVLPAPPAWTVISPVRSWIVVPRRRTWIVKPTTKGSIMLPEKDPEEIKTITFDFSADAAAISEAVVTPSAVSGRADASPGEVLGVKTIDGAKVHQRIKAGQSGTKYALRCKAVDADGEVHIAVALLPIETAAPS